MIFAKKQFAITLLISLLGCESGGNGAFLGGGGATCTNATQNADPDLVVESLTNIIPVHVADPSTTGEIYYPNQPVVAVKVCSPNHTSDSQCTVIQNILLDTGSFGLRVFATTIPSNVVLVQKQVTVPTVGIRDLAQCTIFGTGATWGAIKGADVIMGSQTASNIPIQLISRTTPQLPSTCEAYEPDSDPCTTGFNGILGVGLFAEDCGADCNSTSSAVNPGNYFACGSGGCYNAINSEANGRIPVPLNLQVVNPIAHFSSGFNNGLSITFPDINAAGDFAIEGSMTLGIGTVSNASVKVFDAGPTGVANFITEFTNDGTTYGDNINNSLAFIDSGSNGIFIGTDLAALPQCSSGFFCPSSTQSLNAVIKGYSGSPTLSINFNIANASALFITGRTAYKNLGGFFEDFYDWGMPFYYGKTIYHGLDGTNATFNSVSETGPYWAL